MNVIGRAVVVLGSVMGAAASACGVWAAAQAAAPAESPHTGCVMATEAGEWTFCEPKTCYVVRGADVGPKLAGHKVTVRAQVQEATASTPPTLIVSAVVSIGDACDERCSPRPPTHRGIGHKDKPGSEGGTPGVTAPH